MFKYINFEEIGLVIFEKHITHNHMALMIGHKPISAGFVSLPDKDECGNKASCYGESTSLKLKAADRDTNILRRRLNPYAA